MHRHVDDVPATFERLLVILRLMTARTGRTRAARLRRMLATLAAGGRVA